jgi:hypothetical protein
MSDSLLGAGLAAPVSVHPSNNEEPFSEFNITSRLRFESRFDAPAAFFER